MVQKLTDVAKNALQKQYTYTSVGDLGVKITEVYEKFFGKITETFGNEILNFNTCTSEALDNFWGQIFKINRNFTDENGNLLTLTDEQFREIIKIRAFGTTWDGGIQSMNTFLQELFKDRGSVYMLDPQNMTYEIFVFEFQLEEWEKYLFANYDIFPRASGVASYFEEVLGDVYFGFGYYGQIYPNPITTGFGTYTGAERGKFLKYDVIPQEINPVKLTIYTYPANATVKINGKIQNNISFYPNTIYTYEVSADGYESIQSGGTITQDTILNIDLTKYKTLTINTVPSDAVITINGVEQSSFSAPSGTSYTWSVTKAGYNTQTGSGVLTEDITLNIELELSTATLTINPTPSDAVVTINGVVRKSITLSKGENYSYSVVKDGYYTKSGSGVLTEDITLNIELELSTATLTINPTPSDAVVTINGVVRKSITLSKGENYSYSVVKDGYYTKSGSGVLTEDITLNIELNIKTYSVDILQQSAGTTQDQSWSVVGQLVNNLINYDDIEFANEPYDNTNYFFIISGKLYNSATGNLTQIGTDSDWKQISGTDITYNGNVRTYSAIKGKNLYFIVADTSNLTLIDNSHNWVECQGFIARTSDNKLYNLSTGIAVDTGAVATGLLSGTMFINNTGLYTISLSNNTITQQSALVGWANKAGGLSARILNGIPYRNNTTAISSITNATKLYNSSSSTIGMCLTSDGNLYTFTNATSPVVSQIDTSVSDAVVNGLRSLSLSTYGSNNAQAFYIKNGKLMAVCRDSTNGVSTYQVNQYETYVKLVRPNYASSINGGSGINSKGALPVLAIRENPES